MLTDGKRAAVPQHGIGGTKHVCGIKSRGRAIARHGDHEPDEQMKQPAHRGAAAFQEVMKKECASAAVAGTPEKYVDN